MEKYTYEYCKEICKQYQTKVELRKNHSGVYDKITREGWKNELCKHMTRPEKKHIWTREICEEIVSKYVYLKDFRENERKAYAAIHDNKWQDLLSTLKTVNSCSKRHIYVYEFKKYNVAYIGLTYNVKKRNADHHRKGSVYNFASQHNISAYSPLILKENISSDDAKYFENFYIEEYKNKGWNLLNIAKAGSLGGVTLKNDTIVIFNQNGELIKKEKINKIHEEFRIPLNLIRRCLLHKSKSTGKYKIFSIEEWEEMGSPSKIESFKPKIEEIAIMDEKYNLINIAKNKTEAKYLLGLKSINCSIGILKHNTIKKVNRVYRVCFYSDYEKVQNRECEIIEVPIYKFKRILIIPKFLTKKEKEVFIKSVIEDPQWLKNKRKKQKINKTLQN